MSHDEKKPGRFQGIRSGIAKRVQDTAKQAQEKAQNLADSEDGQRLIRMVEKTSKDAAEAATRVGAELISRGARIRSAISQIDTTELDKNFAQFRSILVKERYEGKPAVLVIGRTGAGKSTLINKIIGSDAALTGSGEPITQDFHLYGNDELPVEFYDSPGWEGGKEKAEAFLANTQSLLRENQHQIQVIWYVIDAQSTRLVDFEIDLLTRVLHRKPVCLLLTKCDVAKDEQIIGVLQAIIGARLPSQIGAYEIAAYPIEPLDDELRERFDYKHALAQSYDVMGIQTEGEA